MPDGQSLDLLTVRRVPAGTSPAKIIMPSPGTIASPNTIARLNPSIMPSPRHAPVQSGSHLAGGGLRLGNWCEPPSCGLRLSRWLVIRAPRLFDRRSLGKAPARRPAHRFWREHRRAVCDTAFDGPRCDVLQSRQPAADLLTVAGYDQKSLPAPVRPGARSRRLEVDDGAPRSRYPLKPPLSDGRSGPRRKRLGLGRWPRGSKAFTFRYPSCTDQQSKVAPASRHCAQAFEIGAV